MCLGFLIKKRKSELFLAFDESCENLFENSTVVYNTLSEASGHKETLNLKQMQQISVLGKGNFGAVILIKY